MEALRRAGGGRGDRSGAARGPLHRPRRPQRRRQDHHAVDDHRAAAPGHGPGDRRWARRVGRHGRGEEAHRRAARGPADVRAPLRPRTAGLHGPDARAPRRGDRQAGHAAPRRPGPRGLTAQAGRRLLHGHAQEDRPGGRAPAQPRSPLPGRAVRGRRPGVGADHPRGAGTVHRLRCHRRVLLPRDGARRIALRLGGRDGRRADPRRRPAGRRTGLRALPAERLPRTRRRAEPRLRGILDWLGGAR